MSKKIRRATASLSVRKEIASYYADTLERSFEKELRKKIILSDQLEALTGGKNIVMSPFSGQE